MSDDVTAFGTYALPAPMERLRRFSQGLGRSSVARRACSVIRRVVSAGRSGPFDVEPFPGQKARLYPHDNLSEKRVFGGAQFWDWAERAALGAAARSGDEPFYFVDAGANVGLYTLAMRAEAGGKTVKALAIEPDRENLSRLRFNIVASGAEGDVTVVPVALSDQAGEVRITTDHSNRGELAVGQHGEPVATRPLLDIVSEAGFPRVDALKIDIEGLELTVLGHFIRTGPKRLWPGLIILEARRGERTPALEMLLESGYHIDRQTRMNVVLLAPALTGDDAQKAGGAHGR